MSIGDDAEFKRHIAVACGSRADDLHSNIQRLVTYLDARQAARTKDAESKSDDYGSMHCCWYPLRCKNQPCTWRDDCIERWATMKDAK